MTLTNLEIVSRAPFEGGQSFGDTGPYERIDAIAGYAVDPLNPANAGIVDLDKAPRSEDGRVHFSGDLTILQPANPARGNRALLLDVPNRGSRPSARSILLGDPPVSPRDIPFNDGMLLRRGWSIAWPGWQWDVPRAAGRLGLDAPRVPPEALGDNPGTTQLRIQPSAPAAELPLTDQHVGALGNHLPITPTNIEDPAATLYVRDGVYGEPATIPRDAWSFTADGARISLASGFEPGRIYDIVYRPAECPVVGTGLLAIRDCATFLKSADTANPLATPNRHFVDHVIGYGVSQCGRFLRHYLHLGLNLDEDGDQALDGALIHVAGGRRGEFNHRFAQPSVQPTPSFGHRFPFADDAQEDPATGKSEGLLDRQRARGGVPRVIQTDTSYEYWRSDAALTHVDAATGHDVEPPEEVRRYLFASTQHQAGTPALDDRTAFGTRGANPINVIDYRPLVRAALVNLLDWVRGTPPPASVFPRWRDGTAATREDVAARLAELGALAQPLALPDIDACPSMRPLDLGPRAADGVGTFPARVAGIHGEAARVAGIHGEAARVSGDGYPAVVSAIDDDGNETGGIRLPDIELPVATHTGFNPRHPETGGGGQILDYSGSTVPFEATRIHDRYPSRDAYRAAAREVAEQLVRARYLLPEDVERCVTNAAARYDLVSERPQ